MLAQQRLGHQWTPHTRDSAEEVSQSALSAGGTASVSRSSSIRRSSSAPGAAEKQLARLQDAFVDAIDRASASASVMVPGDAQSRELRSLSNVRLAMDDLLSLLAKLRTAGRHSGTSKAAVLGSIDRARRDLVTAIRMEGPSVRCEQALLREVMAFADMDDSDGDSSDGSSEEQSGVAAAPVAFSRTSAPPQQVPGALIRPPPPPVAARGVAPPPPPAPAPAPAPAVRQPLAPRVDLLNSSPAPRLAHQGSKLGLLFGKQGLESPTGVLPPSHGTVAPGMYTYFDTHRGELVTARLLRADSGPGMLVEPPPMLVRVPPPEEAEEEDAMQLNSAAHQAAADDADADALLPPPPPAALAAEKPPSHRARRASAPPARRRGGGFPVGMLVRSAVVAATGVALTLLGVKHRDTGVRAASAAVSHAQRAWQAAAATGQAVVATALACVPAGEGQPPRMTEWQRTTAAPVKARDARSVREVRWQPHVALGRG